ncbi:Gfo/Idh/MocA family oxidoreductase [Acaricomes phytoseiuli]|uniref:Gfo/Idh/MocA family protein n=1 Tax=Acaricomes phytoseiuli TaxID=291968 RepID=UPI000369017A|nr:Gfo/Idh/MocA family oxidoreductase [Acaricomes phytoseiuli]MCW1248952.1 Gfo/Idh/MocA family oxidoreductase [Acaricomes phytoseiuli]
MHSRHILRPGWYTSDGLPDPSTATGKPLRWGVVSTGKIAHAVLPDLLLLADAIPYAVSSRSEQHAETFARTFGFERWYADDGQIAGYQQLVEDPAVDIVYIGAPHGQHYEIAAAALRSGKHVLCEKALTINAAETEALIDLARAEGRFLMEAVWSRFVPGMQRAFELIAEGAIGDIRWVKADLGFPAPDDPESRLWAAHSGGGALLDLSVYPLLWAWGALGAPESVQAQGTLTAPDPEGYRVDAQNALTLGYPGGAIAQLMSSLQSQCSRTATVCGTSGIIETVGPRMNNPLALRIHSGWQGDGWEVDRLEEFELIGSGYSYEFREVTLCIQQGLLESQVMPWQDSLDTMRFFDRIRTQLGITYPHDRQGS